MAKPSDMLLPPSFLQQIRQQQEMVEQAMPVILRQAQQRQEMIEQAMPVILRQAQQYQEMVEQTMPVILRQVQQHQEMLDRLTPGILRQAQRHQDFLDSVLQGLGRTSLLPTEALASKPLPAVSPELERLLRISELPEMADGLGPRWEGQARDWENKLLTQTLTGEDVEGVIKLSQQTIEAVTEAASGEDDPSRRLTIMQAALLSFVLNTIINYYTPLLTEKGISQEAVATFKDLLPLILLPYTDQSASGETVPPGR